MKRSPLLPNERYRHDALTSPERQIRLLTVLPSLDDDIYQYRLDTHILGDHKCPDYYALSYEWGTAQHTKNVSINGRLFKIRSNLADFLALLHDPERDFHRPLWIDAICIDQNNNNERNAQVKVMGRIFETAIAVWTWLGMPANENIRLIDAVDTLKKWEGDRGYRMLINPERFESLQRRSSMPKLLSTAVEYNDLWACIRHLCQQSFWRRCWIVQEQIKARSLLLLWGAQQIRWDTLAIAFRTIYLHLQSFPEAAQQCDVWTPVIESVPYKIWLHVQGPQDSQHSILELMETYRTSACSLPHDKAYAFIGIASNSSNLEVNYDKSLADVYADLIQLIPHPSQCLKYSHLAVSALGLSSEHGNETETASILRGHVTTCDATPVGNVQATRRVTLAELSAFDEKEIVDIFVAWGTLPLIDELTAFMDWLSRGCTVLQTISGPETALTLFYLSNQQLGLSLSHVIEDDSIFALSGCIGGPETIHVRAESSKEVSSGMSSPSSPMFASPTSTSFSDLTMSPVTRVWLPEVLTLVEVKSNTPITIPLPDLVALDSSLDLNFAEGPQLLKTESRSRNRGPSVTTHHMTHSDPIASALDGALRSPRVKHASTWPTNSERTTREMLERLSLKDNSTSGASV